MLFNWWDARDVVEIGTALADCFRPPVGREAPADRQKRPLSGSQRELESLLRRVTAEVGPRRLGLFKRARLLNAFKWRLREHGFGGKEADELTHMILFQLYGSHRKIAAPASGQAPGPIQASARRITPLLAEADAQLARGRRSDRIASLRRVLRIDPDHAAHAKLDATLCYLGQYDEAERMLSSTHAAPRRILIWERSSTTRGGVA